MSSPAPDRALRQMVVDLATLHADDVAAVLSEFDAGQRATIEGLLRDFSGFGFIEQMPAPAAVAYDPSLLSPWLVRRLEAEGGETTARTRDALRDCASRLAPPVAAPSQPRPRATLRGRLGSLMTGRQAS